MALITCPHCGERVSDLSDVCNYCHRPLKEQPAGLRQYCDLSPQEKRQLISIFEREHPACSFRSAEKKECVLQILGWCFFSVSVLLSLIFGFTIDSIIRKELHWLGITLFGLAFVMMIVGVVLFFCSKSVNKKCLLYHKCFQQWLLKRESIDYQFEIPLRLQKKFDSIDMNDYI